MVNKLIFKCCFLCEARVDSKYGNKVYNEFICGDCLIHFSSSELKERIKKKLFKDKEGQINIETLILD
jgi:hypothetical protein